jgi:uncharacterized protein (DUF1501 family)
MASLSRRTFLRQAGCAALTTTSLASTILDLKMMGALSQAHAQSLGGYKALVCVFLYGGNDGFNMLIPTATEDLALYQAGRNELALNSGLLLPLNALNTSGRTFALHPNMSRLQGLFNSGKAAIIANVGTLMTPITRSDWRNKTKAVPQQLFSHNDQALQWQTSVSDRDSLTGWGGRVADIVNSANGDSSVSMLLSLHPQGANSFQVGNSTNLFAVPSNGPKQIEFFGTAPLGTSTNSNDIAMYQAFQQILGHSRVNLMQNEYGGLVKDSIDKSQTLAAALSGVADFATPFPTSRLGQQLKMVAKLIAIRGTLELNRQIFFCSDGGYDTHGLQLEAHSNLLGELDQAIGAFHAATVELGVENLVTTFTASDFGRTFTSNGKGSDHGWGSNHLVLGGAVSGQRIYGAYPELIIDGDYDTGRGRWIPTTSVDQYSATLARWFGVGDSQLTDVFPNLGNFNDRTLGFV